MNTTVTGRQEESEQESLWEPYVLERELLLPTPRPARLAPSIQREKRIACNLAGAALVGFAIAIRYASDKSEQVNTGLFVMLVFLFIVSVSYAVWREGDGRECLQLLQNGVVAEGYVAEQVFTVTEGVQTFTLRYGYVIPDGRSYEGISAFPKTIFESHPKGASLTILYDPNDPGRNLPYILMTKAQIIGAPAR